MRARQARDKSLQDLKEDSMNRLMKDINLDRAKNSDAALDDRWTPEEEDGEDNGDDLNIINKSNTARG
jgi:hypothetical protein